MEIRIKPQLTLFDDKKFLEGTIISSAILAIGILMLYSPVTRTMGPALIGFGLGFWGAVYSSYTKRSGDKK